MDIPVFVRRGGKEIRVGSVSSSDVCIPTRRPRPDHGPIASLSGQCHVNSTRGRSKYNQFVGSVRIR